jgi:arylamine N-acetyltransferase
MSQHSEATSVFLELYQLSASRPDLRTLGDVAGRFAELPWENLTKYLKKHAPGRPSGGRAPLDPDRLGDGLLRRSAEVLRDHARLGAGGTCFSLTNALRRIVTDLGFEARPVMADMRHGANLHCALLVAVEGRRYLLDPGYLVAEPVPLDELRPVRLRQAGSELEYRPLGADADGQFELRSRNARGEERLCYRLRSAPVPEAEFVRHWIASFDSTGMRGLHLNRIGTAGRLSAHDLNLRIDAGRAKRNLKLRDGYAEKVAEHFRIDRELARKAFACWERRRCPER